MLFFDAVVFDFDGDFGNSLESWDLSLAALFLCIIFFLAALSARDIA